MRQDTPLHCGRQWTKHTNRDNCNNTKRRRQQKQQSVSVSIQYKVEITCTGKCYPLLNAKQTTQENEQQKYKVVAYTVVFVLVSYIYVNEFDECNESTCNMNVFFFFRISSAVFNAYLYNTGCRLIQRLSRRTKRHTISSLSYRSKSRP